MKKVFPQDSWLDSWKYSYIYDLQELYGEIVYRGYVYSYQNRQRHTLNAIKKYAPNGSKILDIAAAQGNFSLALAEQGYKVTWNDLREELAEYVEMKREKGIINFAPGNAFELDFEEKFDVVLITEIIEHVAHPDDFLKKVSALVKPDGIIVMTTPNGEFIRNTLPKFSDCPDPSQFESVQFKPNSDGHIFLLYGEEVYQLAESAGLNVSEIKFFTNPLTAGFMKTEILLKFFPKILIDKIESLTTGKNKFNRKINTHLLSVFQKKSIL